MTENLSPDDEIVFVDDDGLGFTRADYPAVDYPVGTRVCMGGVPEVEGTVVEAADATGLPGEDGPALHVPVRWDTSDGEPGWQHVDGLKRL